MNKSAADDAASFEPLRGYLVGLAYRMLGSRAEAEDVVQTTAVEIREGKVVALYVTRNPDKLRHLH